MEVVESRRQRISTTPSLPRSATHGIVALSGLAGLIAAFVFLLEVHPFSDTIFSAFFLLTGIAGAVFAVDLLWGKAHLRPTTGLDFSQWRPSIGRFGVKFVGLLGTVGLLTLIYSMFPEYHGSFYDRYFSAARLLLPIGLICSIPYFYCIDAVMVAPEDGFWQFGMLVLLRFDRIDPAKLSQHALSWLVKGFFLALMFTYLCDDLDGLLVRRAVEFDGFKSFYDYSYSFLYFTDVSFATAGYIFSFRLTDTHFRSAEPTAAGWVAALVCYEPFWSLVGANYLAYDPGRPWGAIFGGNSVLYALWGSAILASIAVYVWATVIFGCRFSNLTHRGIITNGPYRFTKHPAYICKNLSFWMISLPFLSGGLAQALRHALLLLLLNGVYFLRAWTEERHLSTDPTYRAYAQWIAKNGLFALAAGSLSHLTTSRAASTRP
ncbi:MAG TPA: isoprenylcysteine carboxylmethyltransferase family protein [Roseiarcus sp.]|nr:isoprenylcysteine carboxylmethyltransferase family protein [Roseiarcus sp.]